MITRGDRLVGVENQDPVAGSPIDAEVARQAEILLPNKPEHSGAK